MSYCLQCGVPTVWQCLKSIDPLFLDFSPSTPTLTACVISYCSWLDYLQAFLILSLRRTVIIARLSGNSRYAQSGTRAGESFNGIEEAKQRLWDCADADCNSLFKWLSLCWHLYRPLCPGTIAPFPCDLHTMLLTSRCHSLCFQHWL